MKRALVLFIAVLCLLLNLSLPVLAAAPVVTLSGPATIRAGQTITVAVRINGSGLRAVRGEIHYDAGRLTYKSSGGELSGWKFDISSTAGKLVFLGEDDKYAAPITGQKQLFTLTFQVGGGVAAGTEIQISARSIEATDGNTDFTPANAIYAVKTAAALSSNAFLSSLKVDNAAISPAFEKNVTQYTASVPFSETKLNLTATPEHSGAKVSISNNNLAAGATTSVTVTVTAENGTKKTYVIRTARQRDPNAPLNSKNDLSSITVEGFRLSPAFQPDVTSYVVWLPFETSEISVSGKAADSKATVEVVGGTGLQPGQDNTVSIICTAEDGSKKEYTIIAKRAPAHQSGGVQSDASMASAGSTSKQETSAASSSVAAAQGTGSAPGTKLWLVLVVAAVCLALGYLLGVIYGRMTA